MSYFKPLRRKLGVVTLLIACAFAAGWLRSQSLIDDVYYPIKPLQSLGLRSQDGHLGMAWVRNNALGARPVANGGWSTQPFESIHDFASILNGWSSYCVGFGSLSYHVPDEATLRAWFVPYWSIVAPLTALSAWLLLSKSRPAPAKVPA